MARRYTQPHGAWKIAYGDFVTTMMAVFLVLWISSQDEKIKEAVERSFKNPFSSMPSDSGGGLVATRYAQASYSQGRNIGSSSPFDLEALKKVSDDLHKSFHSETGEEDPLNLQMTPEGLRVNIFDRARKPIFEANSAEFTQYGKWVFSTLAWQVSRYPKLFFIELEGHTEAGHSGKDDSYTNWELTADRANSARRVLQDHGVKSSQVRKVAGLADTIPLPEIDVSDERNRRVTLLLRAKQN